MKIFVKPERYVFNIDISFSPLFDSPSVNNIKNSSTFLFFFK